MPTLLRSCSRAWARAASSRRTWASTTTWSRPSATRRRRSSATSWYQPGIARRGGRAKPVTVRLEKTRSSGPNPGAVPLLAVDDHATGDRPEQRQARVGDVTAGGLEDDVECAPHGGPHVVHPVRAGVVDTEIGAEPAGEVQLGRRAGGRDDLLAHLLAPRTADLQAHLAAAGLDLDRRARAVADLVDAVLR